MHPVLKIFDFKALRDASSHFKRIFTQAIENLALFSVAFLCTLPLLPGTASAATRPHGLPANVVAELKSYRAELESKGNGTSLFHADAAELLSCHPYCESIGKVIFDSPADYEDGLKLVPEQDLKKVQNLKVISANSKIFQGLHPADQPRQSSIALPQTDPRTDPRTASAPAPTSNTPGSGKAQAQAQAQADDKPIRPELLWQVYERIGLFLGERSLSTASNTDTNSGDNLHGIGNAALGLVSPVEFKLFKSDVSFGFELAAFSSFAEESSIDPTRTWQTQELDLRVPFYFQPHGAPWTNFWKFGLTLGGKLVSWNTNTETALGFSTQTIFPFIGLQATYKIYNFQIDKSVLGLTTDDDNYRGTSVSSSFTSFKLMACPKLSKSSFFVFEICPQIDLELRGDSGSGAPLRSVFSSSPVYTYTSWDLGFSLRLTELFEGPKDDD